MGVTKYKLECMGIREALKTYKIKYVFILDNAFNKFKVYDVASLASDITDLQIHNIGNNKSSAQLSVELFINSFSYYDTKYNFIILIKTGDIYTYANGAQSLSFKLHNYEIGCNMEFNTSESLYKYVSEHYRSHCMDIKDIDLQIGKKEGDK